MIRPSGLCQARIRILQSVSSKLVRIERCKDSPNHSHHLKESDRLKRSEAIRTLVKQEAIKSYPPVAIVDAVKDLASDKLSLGNSVQELKRKEVANIKYQLRGPMEIHLVGSDKLNSDVLAAVSYLKEQEYYVEHYYTSQQPTKGTSRRSTQGFVFTRPQQLEKLQLHGWLTQMDSTHKTNKHDWHLFTLYIRDGYGCWDVGAHFFVSNEDSETIAQALRIVRNQCPRWTPQYFFWIRVVPKPTALGKFFPVSMVASRSVKYFSVRFTLCGRGYRRFIIRRPGKPWS